MIQEIEGIEELYSKIKTIRGKIKSLKAGEYAQDLGNLALMAKWRVQSLTPKGETSRHANAWKTTRVRAGKGMGATVTVYNRLEDEDPPILLFLEFGTRPHLILPTKAQYLSFQINDEWISTKYVVHPGTKPYAMVAITREEFMPRMKELGEKWLNEIDRIWATGG